MKTKHFIYAIGLAALPLLASCSDDDFPTEVKPAATGTFTDADGREYRTVKYGQTEWMAENYRGGDPWVEQSYLTDNGLEYWFEDDFDIDGYFSDMFLAIVKNVLDRNSEKLDPFYAFSEEYYGEDLETFGWESLTEQETWDLGFFEYNESSYWGNYFPYKSGDLQDWIEAVTTMSRAEFEAAYGSSATMMNKYETLVGIIESLGIEL